MYQNGRNAKSLTRAEERGIISNLTEKESKGDITDAEKLALIVGPTKFDEIVREFGSQKIHIPKKQFSEINESHRIEEIVREEYKRGDGLRLARKFGISYTKLMRAVKKFCI